MAVEYLNAEGCCDDTGAVMLPCKRSAPVTKRTTSVGLRPDAYKVLAAFLFSLHGSMLSHMLLQDED